VIRNISDIFLHSDLGRRQGLRVQGGSHVPTRRSPWSHQSPSMRGALGLNPRNIHTGVPTRYYRGIIQTYLYPSPMTADMTCDRLRYRLHDMPRSLSLAPFLLPPSQFFAIPFERPPPVARSPVLPRSRPAIADGKYATCTTCNPLAFMCFFALETRASRTRLVRPVGFIVPTESSILSP